MIIMHKKEIAMRIRALREERNLHQKEVAAVLGISQPAYSDLENGHTMFTAIALDKLADFYGMGLDELLHQNGATLNMYDRSSNGYNAYHMEHRHGMDEEVVGKFLSAIQANTEMMKVLAEQQAALLKLVSKNPLEH